MGQIRAPTAEPAEVLGAAFQVWSFTRLRLLLRHCRSLFVVAPFLNVCETQITRVSHIFSVGRRQEIMIHFNWQHNTWTKMMFVSRIFQLPLIQKFTNVTWMLTHCNIFETSLPFKHSWKAIVWNEHIRFKMDARRGQGHFIQRPSLCITAEKLLCFSRLFLPMEMERQPGLPCCWNVI